MTDKKLNPARFLMVNSKGHPDFIMTMLVSVTLALFLVLLFWMMLNLLALKLSLANQGANSIVKLLDSFNENARLLVLGISSSVFSLAGAYYLRRQAHDKHYVEYKKAKHEMGIIDKDEEPRSVFTSIGESTLSHPNYDDEEEDI